MQAALLERARVYRLEQAARHDDDQALAQSSGRSSSA